MKFIVYYTKFKISILIVKNNTNSPKTSLKPTNEVYKFTCPFRECLSKNNLRIDCTATTLSRRLTYHLSHTSALKQHLIAKNRNDTEKPILRYAKDSQ